MGRLWKGVDAALQTQDVQWSISRIELSNLASIQSHERLGARHIATGVFLVLGTVQLSLFSKAPYIHLGIKARHQPELMLQPPLTKMAPEDIRITSCALVIGVDSHGLAVARALHDGGVTVYAIEKNSHPPGSYSNIVRQTFWAADFDDSTLLRTLVETRAKLSGYESVALFAINDRHVELIGNNLAQLQPLYKISWSNCSDKILALQPKDALETRSRQQGLNYPKSVLFDATGQPHRAQGMRFPVIIKPVRPLSSFKTHIASNLAELEALLLAHPQDLPILGQEYIDGDDQQLFFGALMLDSGHVLHGMAGRKIASYPPARGQTTVAETTENTEVLRLTKLFFEGLNLSGPVSLELKRDPEGNLWVIEPTVGRTDFWVQLCISAGFNQPLMEYQLLLGRTPSQPPLTQPCVWYDSERDPFAYPALCWKHKTLRPRGKRQVFAYWRYDDWRPAIVAIYRLLTGKVWHRLRRLRRHATSTQKAPHQEK